MPILTLGTHFLSYRKEIVHKRSLLTSEGLCFLVSGGSRRGQIQTFFRLSGSLQASRNQTQWAFIPHKPLKRGEREEKERRKRGKREEKERKKRPEADGGVSGEMRGYPRPWTEISASAGRDIRGHGRRYPRARKANKAARILASTPNIRYLCPKESIHSSLLHHRTKHL